MSKQAHTPGPWAAWWNEAGGRFYIHAADGQEVARVPNNRIEATQNADLIAQAPTLLAENERLRAACREALDYLEALNAKLIGGTRSEAVRAQLRAALNEERTP